MHIPPYYKRKEWQRFLAGTFVGAILAYAVFIYMYGQLYENWVEQNMDLRAELQELEASYEALEKNNEELDQRYQQRLMVSSIDIVIMNHETFRLDRFILQDLEEMIKEEVKEILGREVSSVTENHILLLRMIENKVYNIEGSSYQAEVRHLFISESSEIHLELKIAD